MSELLTITCPECSGEIGVPTEFIGSLKCPQCGVLVYSKDANTGVTWKIRPIQSTIETLETVHVEQGGKATGAEAIAENNDPHASPQPFVSTADNGSRWGKDGRVSKISIACVSLGIFGILFSVGGFAELVERRPNTVVNVVSAAVMSLIVNPLIYVGVYGLVRRNKEISGVIPFIPPKKRGRVSKISITCLVLGTLGLLLSVANTIEIQQSRPGTMVNVGSAGIISLVLNPLIYVGIYGFMRRENEINHTLKRKPSYTKHRSLSWVTIVCLILGPLGLFGGAVVTLNDQSGATVEGFFVNALLNPLVWAGCYGVYSVCRVKRFF